MVLESRTVFTHQQILPMDKYNVMESSIEGHNLSYFYMFWLLDMHNVIIVAKCVKHLINCFSIGVCHLRGQQSSPTIQVGLGVP